MIVTKIFFKHTSYFCFSKLVIEYFASVSLCLESCSQTKCPTTGQVSSLSPTPTVTLYRYVTNVVYMFELVDPDLSRGRPLVEAPRFPHYGGKGFGHHSARPTAWLCQMKIKSLPETLNYICYIEHPCRYTDARSVSDVMKIFLSSVRLDQYWLLNRHPEDILSNFCFDI